MSKLPAIQFYYGDWKKDANLAMCSLSTRGFWHEILGAMHELGRSGQITGTAQQLARVCRCTAAEAVEAIRELGETRAANISERNGVYTLINRRMKRESDERNSTRERVSRFRKKGNVTNGNATVTLTENVDFIGEKDRKRESNGNVTPVSSSSTSASVTNLNNDGGDRKGQSQENSIAGNLPNDSKAKTEQRLDDLQSKYPHLDVRQVRKKYLKWCGENGKIPKWQIFEERLLKTEYESMEIEPEKSVSVDWNEAQNLIAKKYGGKNVAAGN